MSVMGRTSLDDDISHDATDDDHEAECDQEHRVGGDADRAPATCVAQAEREEGQEAGHEEEQRVDREQVVADMRELSRPLPTRIRPTPVRHTPTIPADTVKMCIASS